VIGDRCPLCAVSPGLSDGPACAVHSPVCRGPACGRSGWALYGRGRCALYGGLRSGADALIPSPARRRRPFTIEGTVMSLAFLRAAAVAAALALSGAFAEGAVAEA